MVDGPQLFTQILVALDRLPGLFIEVHSKINNLAEFLASIDRTPAELHHGHDSASGIPDRFPRSYRASLVAERILFHLEVIGLRPEKRTLEKLNWFPAGWDKLHKSFSLRRRDENQALYLHAYQPFAGLALDGFSGAISNLERDYQVAAPFLVDLINQKTENGVHPRGESRIGLTVNVRTEMVTLDGISYPVSFAIARMFQEMLDKEGAHVSLSTLGLRKDRNPFQSMPLQLRELIEVVDKKGARLKPRKKS